MAAPTRRQSTTSTQTALTARPNTYVFPSDCVAGNMIVVCLAGDKNTGTLTVSDNVSGSTGWTVETSIPGASVSLYIARKVAVGGERTITATTSADSSTGNTGYAEEMQQAGAGAWMVVAKATPTYSDTSRTSATSGTTDSADHEGRALAVGVIDSMSNLTSDTGPTFSNFTRINVPARPSGSGGGNAGCYVGEANMAAAATTSTTFATNGGSDQLTAAIAAFGRVVATGPAPVNESGSFATQVADVYSNRINSSADESYDVPTQPQADAMAAAFGKLMTGDFTGAAVDVDPYGYDVVLFTDTSTSRDLAMLRERTPCTRFWGLFVWNRDAGRTTMIVEAPHPKFDTNTHTEAASLFSKNNSRAFLLATTHRNANAATEADGDRVTDVANYGGVNVFQEVHEVVHVAGTTAVQIHGYANATDPHDIIISEGQPVPSARTLQLADDLAASPGAFDVGVYDGTVGTALGATGNVQGQWSRGQTDRFWIHVEQNSDVRSSATLRGYVEDVLAAGIPEPTPPAPGELFDLSRWHLTLPTEDPGPDTDAAQIDQPELATYQDANNYTENGMIVCRAPVVGATTSGASGATRDEYREHEAGSYANSAWDPLTTGRRQLTITTHVDASNITGGTTPRKESIVFQIHGAGDSPIPLILAAEYHVATPRIRVYRDGPGFDNPVLGITPTTPVTIRCRVENARMHLWVIAGQVGDLPATPTYDWPISGTFTDLEGWFFKWGTYNKTTITSASSGESYARISYVDLLQPGDPEPAPLVEPGRMLLALP